MWKRMKDTEVKAKIILDDMPLSALYKVSETHTHTQGGYHQTLAVVQHKEKKQEKINSTMRGNGGEICKNSLFLLPLLPPPLMGSYKGAECNDVLNEKNVTLSGRREGEMESSHLRI